MTRTGDDGCANGSLDMSLAGLTAAGALYGRPASSSSSSTTTSPPLANQHKATTEQQKRNRAQGAVPGVHREVKNAIMVVPWAGDVCVVPIVITTQQSRRPPSAVHQSFVRPPPPSRPPVTSSSGLPSAMFGNVTLAA